MSQASPLNQSPPLRPSSAWIIRSAYAGTTVFVLTAIASAVALRELNELVVVVSLTLFAIGCGAFLWAFAIAVERSRSDAIGIGGLFFLLDSAPRSIQLRLFGALTLQIVVAIATAAFRPFTSQAFAVLAPMFGLGVMGLWGARYGKFARRNAVD